MPPEKQERRFPVPYPRPTQLSDPFNDFLPSFLQGVVDTRDEELCHVDFVWVFAVGCPGGTYEESAYFLPLAFDYMEAEADGWENVFTPLVWFCSEYADQLDADGLLETVRREFAACLARWTRAFRVVHWDRDAVRAMGSGRGYWDFVDYSLLVSGGIDDLLRFERHADLAVAFVRGLADGVTATPPDPVRAAWLLEYARSLPELALRTDHPAITALVEDRELLEKAAKVVRQAGDQAGGGAGERLSVPSPTYWRDTFRALGLDA